MNLSPRDPALSQWHNFMADAEIGLGDFDTAMDECIRQSTAVTAFFTRT